MSNIDFMIHVIHDDVYLHCFTGTSHEPLVIAQIQFNIKTSTSGLPIVKRLEGILSQIYNKTLLLFELRSHCKE